MVLENNLEHMSEEIFIGVGVHIKLYTISKSLKAVLRFIKDNVHTSMILLLYYITPITSQPVL